MDLLDLITKRYSGRSYDGAKVVTQEQIDMLIEAARWAPSCYGDEPWRYVICNKQKNLNSWNELFDCLTQQNQKWVKDCALLIICCSAKNFRDLSRGSNNWGSYDTGSATYGMMLGATSMGLMAHQMAGFDRDRVTAKFDISEDFDVMSVMAIGYAKEGGEPSERKRRPIKEIFFYDKWHES
ncbi:nitroreductase family protein [Candidatus Mesenet endosymbiont of Agriotes lineatus]|uniref:nitroreductase family protein n=1 Tax=Candidatus Mesenet endosymbiont of Agriotes lineatus TaxID=3077948 RepID=UPI0030D31C33